MQAQQVTQPSGLPLLGEALYRRIVQHCAAALCKAIGFTAIEEEALALVIEAIASYMNKLCLQAKECCEHAGRLQVNLLDAQQSLALDGVKLSELCRYLQQSPLNVVAVEVAQQSSSQPPATLKVGEGSRIANIPHLPGFLPPLPDPHTYMRTEISGELDLGYEYMREAASINRRNVEDALENYVLSVAPTTSLYRHLEEEVSVEAKRMLATQVQNNDDPFVTVESEKSYLKRYIPTCCQVLLPGAESGPAYLSALLNDEEILDTVDKVPNHLVSLLEEETCEEETLMNASAADDTILSLLGNRRS